jgi:hypothetical protein
MKGFLEGTFVGSNNGSLTRPPTTPVDTPAGLQYSEVEAKKHSVRGVLWAKGALYVADQPASTVKVYDATGKYLGQSNKLVESPVQLLAHDGSLYVSSGDRILTAKLPSPPGAFSLTTIGSIKVKNASGMAFSDSGHLYVASRTENRILKFDSGFHQMAFRCDLPDNPEFLLHV